MVFTSLINFGARNKARAPNKGPDEIWRKRRIFKMAATFFGRRRNCYSIAVRGVHRALQYCTISRKQKKLDMRDLRDTRITAGAQQFGIEYETFRECLKRSNILLNRKVLADLAMWEPKTFESLAMVARDRGIQDGARGVNEIQNEGNRVVYYDDEQQIEKEKYDGVQPANYGPKYKNITAKYVNT